MEAFVKYLYGYNVEEVLCSKELSDDGGPVLQMEILLELYDIAEKYGYPNLASLVLSKFEETCCYEFSGQQLKVQPNWWEYMAKHSYNNAGDHDRTLWRQALLRLTCAHSAILIENEDLIREVTKDVPGFAADLVLQGGLDGEGIKKT